MSDPELLYLGHISHVVAKGQRVGTPDEVIFFHAPVDLIPDDQVVVDPGSGQPLGIYRDERLIWQFEDERVMASISGTLAIDPSALSNLLRVMA